MYLCILVFVGIREIPLLRILLIALGLVILAPMIAMVVVPAFLLIILILGISIIVLAHVFFSFIINFPEAIYFFCSMRGSG